MKSKTILRTMCLAVPLAIVGCGGGGGGNSEPAPQGGTTPSSNGNGSSTGNNTPTTPVITLSESALTIAAGGEAQVSIKVTDDKGLTSSSLGCGDNLTMIISGSLPSGSPTSYEVSPRIAAAKLSTNAASSCTLKFGDADGNEESVEIKVDITGVNILPTVSAGDDVTVKSGEPVSLTASADDENSDGAIASYQWKQTAGTAATLTGADSKTLSFTPTVSATETLTFEVTVTDNAGGTAMDSVDVNVTVLPSSAVNVFFPIEGSTTDVAVGEELVITGNVEAAAGAEVKVVKLSHDSNTVEAVVDDKGNWRAALTLAAGDDLSIDITAEDSNDGSHQSTLKLNRAIDFSGESVFTRSQQGVVGAAVDSQNNVLYIQSQGDTIADTKLFVFNTESHQLSEFTYTDKVDLFDARSLTSDIEWNDKNNTLYIANQRAIFALDIEKKERTTVNDDFFGVSDIDIDETNGLMYVADNQFNELSKIDLSTNEKQVLIFGGDMNGLISVDHVATDNSLVLSKFSGGNNPFLRVDLAQEQVSSEIIGDADTVSVDSLTYELAMTKDGSRAYFIDQSASLKVIELASQKVEVLQTNVAKISGTPITQNALELDEDKGLLYIVAEDPSGDGFYVLNVVDIATNKMVKKPL